MKRGTTWLDRSIVDLQMQYCLVLNNTEYVEAVREIEGPAAHVGYWLKDETAGATVNWAKSHDGMHHAIVAIKVTPDMTGPQIAARLCHEAVHIFQQQCHLMGEDKPSDEFAAWSIQHIAEALMQDYANRIERSAT